MCVILRHYMCGDLLRQHEEADTVGELDLPGAVQRNLEELR